MKPQPGYIEGFMHTMRNRQGFEMNFDWYLPIDARPQDKADIPLWEMSRRAVRLGIAQVYTDPRLCGLPSSVWLEHPQLAIMTESLAPLRRHIGRIGCSVAAHMISSGSITSNHQIVIAPAEANDMADYVQRYVAFTETATNGDDVGGWRPSSEPHGD